jgi:mannose-6-phosphate isomerase-like protein (cupin superfamily)
MAQGTLNMGIRDPEERVEVVREGEFIIIPRMVEHRPSAEAECEIILLEPKSTLNTGTVEDHELTVKELGSVE